MAARGTASRTDWRLQREQRGGNQPIRLVVPFPVVTVEAGWVLRACARVLLLMPADCRAVGVLRLNRDDRLELDELLPVLLLFNRADRVLFKVCCALITAWVACAWVT